MKRLRIVASVAHMVLLSQLACAAGPYDGEWTGQATSAGGWRCKPANVAVTVAGSEVTGRAKFEVDQPNINGTVRDDGTMGATIGFQPLTGKFSGDEFEGTFKNADCVWKMLLKRTR